MSRSTRSNRGLMSLFRRRWAPTDFGPHNWGDFPGARLDEGATATKADPATVTTLCSRTAAIKICDCEPRCA